jgi:vitamin B12 transporter
MAPAPYKLDFGPLIILALTPITVTATRSQQDSRLVSSTVITRQDIERKQFNSVEQALRGIAGVNITNSGGLGKATSVFLRGTNSSHVLVLIDGVRVGSATLGTEAWQYLPISEIDLLTARCSNRNRSKS